MEPSDAPQDARLPAFRTCLGSSPKLLNIHFKAPAVMTSWSSAAALSGFERRAKNDSKLAWLVAVHFESLGPRERPLNIFVFQPTSRTSTRSVCWPDDSRWEPLGTLLRDEEMRKVSSRQWTDMKPCDGGHDGRGAHGLRCAHAPFSALGNLAAPTTTLATN